MNEAGCDSTASNRRNKPHREIRRHKFSVTAAQVSPLSWHLLLTRINIPLGLITQYSYAWTYMRARVSEMHVIVPVCNTSDIIGDAEVKITTAQYPITDTMVCNFSRWRYVVNLRDALQNCEHFCPT